MDRFVILVILALICSPNKAQVSFGVYAAPHTTQIHYKSIPYNYGSSFDHERTHNGWGAGFYIGIPLTKYLYLKNETGYSRNITSTIFSKGNYQIFEYFQSGLLAGYAPFYKQNGLLKGISINAGSSIKYIYKAPRNTFYDTAPDVSFSILLGASFNYKIFTLSPFADLSIIPYSKMKYAYHSTPPYEVQKFFRNYGLKLSCKVF